LNGLKAHSTPLGLKDGDEKPKARAFLLTRVGSKGARRGQWPRLRHPAENSSRFQ